MLRNVFSWLFPFLSARNQGILPLKYFWQTWRLTFHSIFYNTGCVAMRNYFVKSSRQVKISGSVKKDHFIYKCLAVIESLNLFTVMSFYYLQMGKTGRDRSTILLYHTCLGKWKNICWFLTLSWMFRSLARGLFYPNVQSHAGQSVHPSCDEHIKHLP